MTADHLDNDTQRRLARRFTEKYGAAPRLFRAPGRVNLVGEHTDYNEGYVLPAAINLYTCVAIAPHDEPTLQLFSENLKEGSTIDLANLNPKARNQWTDYVQGIVVMLRGQKIALRGADLLIHSNVPTGSGLSSSAALEVSVAIALLGVSGQSLKLIEVARLSQRAENEFVGARCGIMDQFAACFGRAGHAILLDCRSLDYRALPLPGGLTMVICNTMVKHEHAEGGYNTRRSECEEGVRRLRQLLPGVTALRDVSLAQLEEHKNALPETIYRRCRHIIAENARVLEAVDALERGDLAAMGKCMAASHASLRDDFEVSCEELDTMVEAAQKSGGVVGTRMTGGGFGGCTVNLVHTEEVASFRTKVAHEYERATGIVPEIYVSLAGEGAKEIASSS